MYQVIFIVVVSAVLIACYVSMWDDHWKRKCETEITAMNAWLKKYSMTMRLKGNKIGPFAKWVIIADRTNVDFENCKGIGFRKLYKTLVKVRKDSIAYPILDQTGNLASLLYKSQMKKDVKKSIWED